MIDLHFTMLLICIDAMFNDVSQKKVGHELSRELDGKEVRIQRTFIENYEEYQRETFQPMLSLDLGGPVIIVKEIQILKNKDVDASDSEVSVTELRASSCPKRVYTDPANPNYDTAALNCVEGSIKNCEIQTTVMTYEQGSMKLHITKQESGKCFISLTIPDWGDWSKGRT